MKKGTGLYPVPFFWRVNEMKNDQIILNNAIQLMENGIIGTTGKTIEIENEDGTKRTIPEPEPIHTFAAWRSAGFTVRQHEHAVAKFPIWKCKATEPNKYPKAGKGESIAGKMFLAEAFFFSQSQVEPIEDDDKKGS